MNLKFLLPCILISTLFYSCTKDLKKELENAELELKSCKHALDNCKSCSDEMLDKDKEAFVEGFHSSLLLDCNQQETHQLFTSNVSQGYEIFGKITGCENGLITAISFTLIQPGTCNELQLVKAELFEYENKNMPSVTNALLFTINKTKGNQSGLSTVNVEIPNGKIQLPENNLIKTAILSNDSIIGYTGELDPGDIPKDPIGVYENSDCPKICWDGACFQN